MKTLGITLAVLVGLTALAGSADAASILYHVDFIAGTDRMAEALADPAITGSHTVTTATSGADFQTKLGTGTYDLAILFQQGNPHLAPAFASLNAFVAGGGRAIVCDWFRSDANIAGLEATFTGRTNDATVTISDPALAAGLTNPVLLLDPGWVTWSMGLDTAGSGWSAATFGNGDDAIVIGNGGRTIVNGMLSDTFVTGADGVQLYINEIESVLIPEPSTLALVFAGFGGLALARRRYRKA